MEPATAIKTCFSKYVDFAGRAAIAEFWWWLLFVGAAGSVLFAVTPVLAAVFLLAVLMPTAAAAARRLQDTGRSGWWTLLALIPFPGLAFLAALLVFQGTPGANRYGPDPLGRIANGKTPPLYSMKSVAQWQDRR